MKRSVSMKILGLLLAFLIFASNSFAAEPDRYVEVSLIAEKNIISAGETITIGIKQNIYPHWHTYWLNPGDSGEPTNITWTNSADFTIAPLQWPTPKKLPFGPLTNYGYEDTVILLQDITAPADLPAGPITLNARVDLLVCEEICIPETGSYSLTLNDNGPAYPDEIKHAQSLLPQKTTSQLEFFEKEGVFHISFDRTHQNQTSIQNIDFFPIDWGIVENAAETSFLQDNNKVTIQQKRGERPLEEVSSIKGVLSIQDENGKQTAFQIEGGITTNPAALKQNEDVKTDEKQLPLIKAIFYAFLGGLILNLMPCVFPVLSLKALSLCQLKDEESRQAKLHGLSYTAGILLSFGILAMSLLVLKAIGAEIGWGFQLQNPYVILALAYLLFIVGLNLAGFFDINSVAIANVGNKLTQKKGLGGSFFTGVLATIVATPCTAPFMAGAIGFALTQSAIISIAVFLTLGFGLAFPYLALSFFPAFRHGLPKPGPWMDIFKQFLAFPMFASAAWLVWVLAEQTGTNGIIGSLFGFVFIAMGIWVFRVSPKSGPFRWISRSLGTISLLIALTPFWVSMINMGSSKMEFTTQDFSPTTLEKALNSNAPVFVNMTAAWCITCKLNERVAISIPETQELFEKESITYIKGDWTNRDADITAYLNEFGRNGVPLYVFYGERDINGKRPEPVILPQLLTPKIVENAILEK